MEPWTDEQVARAVREAFMKGFHTARIWPNHGPEHVKVVVDQTGAHLLGRISTTELTINLLR